MNPNNEQFQAFGFDADTSAYLYQYQQRREAEHQSHYQRVIVENPTLGLPTVTRARPTPYHQQIQQDHHYHHGNHHHQQQYHTLLSSVVHGHPHQQHAARDGGAYREDQHAPPPQFQEVDEVAHVGYDHHQRAVEQIVIEWPFDEPPARSHPHGHQLHHQQQQVAILQHQQEQAMLQSNILADYTQHQPTLPEMEALLELSGHQQLQAHQQMHYQTQETAHLPLQPAEQWQQEFQHHHQQQQQYDMARAQLAAPLLPRFRPPQASDQRFADAVAMMNAVRVDPATHQLLLEMQQQAARMEGQQSYEHPSELGALEISGVAETDTNPTVLIQTDRELPTANNNTTQQLHSAIRGYLKSTDRRRRGGRKRGNRAVGNNSIANKTYICDICGKGYCRRATLKAHQRSHDGERPFRCDICHKGFGQAANLYAHKRVHTGEKPFICAVCDKRFSQSSSLTTHHRTHTGERPYACHYCTKTFTDSSTRTKHMRTHTGYKPYQCHSCTMIFTQSGNLKRHMKVHMAISVPPTKDGPRVTEVETTNTSSVTLGL